MRFAIAFLITCVLIPFVTLMRENQQRGPYAASIWWLKVSYPEELMRLIEESEVVVEESKKLSKWAKHQRDIASLYSNNFGLGAFCRIPLRLPQQLQHNQYEHRTEQSGQVGREWYKNVELGSDPIVWDASLGEHGSIINIIITSGNTLGRASAALDRDISSGDSSDKSIAPDSIESGVKRNPDSTPSSVLPKRVSCRLYDHRSQLLATVASLRTIDDTLVRCPIPYDIRKHGLGSEVRFGVKLIWPEQVIYEKPLPRSSSGGLGAVGRLDEVRRTPSLPKDVVRLKTGLIKSDSESSHNLNRTLILPILSEISATTSPKSFEPIGGHGIASRLMYPVCPLALRTESKEINIYGVRKDTSHGLDLIGTGTEEESRFWYSKGSKVASPAMNADATADEIARTDGNRHSFLRGQFKNSNKLPSGAISNMDSEGSKYSDKYNISGARTAHADDFILPETLPGWSSAVGSNKISPSAFPSDTAHTYALSICTATSRGNGNTPASVSWYRTIQLNLTQIG